MVAAPKSEDDGVSPDIKANYARWRTECEAYADDAIAGSEIYKVAGRRWVDLVNGCLTAKANDSER